DHIDMMVSFSPLRKITLTGAFQSGKKSQNLQNHQGRQRIIEALFKTPPSFNLDNHENNSFSKEAANNPHWLTRSITDFQTLKNSRSQLDLKYEIKRNIVFKSQFSKNKQWSTHKFGYAPKTIQFINGKLSTSSDQLTEFAINNKLVIRQYISYSHLIQVFLNYSFFNSYYNKEFAELDYLVENLDSLKYAHVKNRKFHNASLIAKWEYDNIIYIDASTSLSKSNTRHKSSLHPYFGLAFNIANINWFRHNIHWLNALKFSANYENSEKEVPINFSSQHFQSLLYTSNKSLQYFPVDNLVNDWLLPESQNKYDFVANLSMFGNRVYLNYSCYKYITSNVVAPVARNNQLHFDNLCEIATNGNELLAGTRYGRWNQYLFLELGYSKSSTLVTKLYSDDWRIPIGGFSNVSNNLIENQPYGVIVGSKYLRNDKNELIIGSDGFPMVDTVLGIIGNPNPDYTMSFNGGYSHKGVNFKVVFKYQHGGDAWNGTRASMNYYGVSNET
ncbi:MAG: hypothetical protein MI922_09290, partial [Bacteroidales bacterium]|nr:hypothetical protein [Bacteroidales bacterium]